MQRLIIALSVVVALLVKAPQFVTPMGSDQGIYNTVAQEILRGGVPYRDAWHPKLPAIFYTHAAVLSLIRDPWRPCKLGSLPGFSRSDLQPRCGLLLFGGVDFAYSLGLATLVFLVGRRLGLSPTASALAFGFTAWGVNLAVLDPEGSTPEKWALAPAVGVIFAGLMALESRPRRWLILAGFLASIAALFKQPDLASFGALSVVLMSMRRQRDLVWLWLPLVVLLPGVWAVFATISAGAQFTDATLSYNLARVGFQSERILFVAARSAWQVFRDGLAPLWLTALIGIPVAIRTRGGRLLVVWAAFDVLALFVGGTKFTHEYFVQLVPSFALLAAVGLQSLWTALAHQRLGRAWVLLSVAAIGLLSSSFQGGLTLRAWNDYVAYGWSTTSIERLASMIAALPADEAVFVWGDEAQLYALSGHLPSTRFLDLTGLSATGDASAAIRRAELLSALMARPPAVIVVDRRTNEDDPDGRLQLNVRAFPGLERLLAERYRSMDDSVLRPYVGGGREAVFVRTGSPDLCQQMSGCRLD